MTRSTIAEMVAISGFHDFSHDGYRLQLSKSHPLTFFGARSNRELIVARSWQVELCLIVRDGMRRSLFKREELGDREAEQLVAWIEAHLDELLMQEAL